MVTIFVSSITLENGLCLLDSSSFCAHDGENRTHVATIVADLKANLKRTIKKRKKEQTP